MRHFHRPESPIADKSRLFFQCQPIEGINIRTGNGDHANFGQSIFITSGKLSVLPPQNRKHIISELFGFGKFGELV
jgi:hypothetical protein